MTIKNLDAREVARLLQEEAIVLVDVRERNEHARERIAGAVLCPLSAFNAHSLPETNGKPIVFQCASGARSATAVATCQKAGLPHDSHLRGGILAWKSAGLPTER